MHFCFCWSMQFAQLKEKEEVVNLRDMGRWRGYWWPIHHSYFPPYHKGRWKVAVQARHYIPNGPTQEPGQSGGGCFYNPNLTGSQECFEALFQKYRINLSKNFGTNAGYYPEGCFQKKRTIYGSINLFSCSEDAIKGGILRIATEKGSQLEELQIYSKAISNLILQLVHLLTLPCNKEI